ncbi:MAG TPA: DUF3455 domain-containing protein [Longimicrobiales bacterium]|nr:DUF3455 domain-containing protein [Longimicrobiales bacterium]
MQSARRLFVSVAAAAMLAACADEAPLSPASQNALPAQFAFGVCDNLDVEAGHELAFHTYARGVQVYRWNGTSWSFVGPVATLYADANEKAVVGTHYSGPTWESVSGSKVVAALVDRCTRDANSIPWLLLKKVSSTGPGVFQGVTFIQRMNTVGGNAPANAGNFIGEVVEIPYTAEYFFYAAQ